MVPALPWFSIVAKQDNMHENHHGFIEIMSYSDKNCLNHASGNPPNLLFSALNFISSTAYCQIFVQELNFMALLYLTDLCRGICVTMSKPLEGLRLWFFAGKISAVSILLLVWSSQEWAFSSHFPQYFLVINLAKATRLRSVKIYRGFSEVLWLSFWSSGISFARKRKF